MVFSLKDKNLYYVGGVVRDEQLKISSLDTDYCFEGNAIEFAKARGLEIIRENAAFGTVRVLHEGQEIDIASTRIETYPRAGHLPEVTAIGCPLEEDLKRRDFTINAMAKRTTDGKIIDIFGGMRDIKFKRLNVLHDKSFVDDPTRIIRGLKFSVRFGFEPGEDTKLLQEAYLNNVNYDMSYHRLKKELVETFNLNKQDAFRRFIEGKMYRLLGENQFYDGFEPDIENQVLKNPTEHIWLVYMSFFNLEKFELTRAERRILDWSIRLKTEKAGNNTPRESILINRLQSKREGVN